MQKVKKWVADYEGASMSGCLLGIDASRATRLQRTGTEAYAYHLIRELIPLAQERGLHLRLYFNEAPPPALFPAAAHIEYKVLPFRRLWTHIRLARELYLHPPHVFFTPSHVIPFSYRGRAVATVHDLGFHYFPEAHTRLQVAYLRWSTQHNTRRSRIVLADSQATKSDLTRFYGVDPAKVVVVYPGVDPELAPVSDEQTLACVQQNYGIRAPYLLYLGTLQPRKNLQRLIEAFQESGVSQQLVLAGKPGWLAEPILQEVSDVEASTGSIRVTGYVSQEDKAALISGASAVLFPSLYEGFGFPILEAQVCKTPVLCGDNSSQPEVAGEAALLVPAEDTEAIAEGIRRLVNDASLRQKFMRKGVMNARRFTWQHAAEQVMDVLEQVSR